MNLSELLGVGEILAVVVGLAVFFFFYFKNEGFRNVVKKSFRFLPLILSFVPKLFKDKKGEFDLHDLGEVLQRVSEKIQTTVNDPANVSFEDVEDEIFEIVRAELANYKNMPKVPAIDDPELRNLVRVAFENLQRVLRED